jgi:hypothetical protein
MNASTASRPVNERFLDAVPAMALHEARDSGLIPSRTSIEATAGFISGGTNELALWVYHQRDRQAALKDSSGALRGSH